MSNELDDTKMFNDLSDEMQETIAKLKDNMLIALVKRNGGKLVIPVKEIDEATDLLTMHVEGDTFIVETKARN